MAGIARGLATAETPPDYVAVAADPRDDRAGGRMRVFLGTIPDYANSDTMGVALSGVSPGGPAEQAGLRAGDTIVEVAGRPIENIYDYTYVLEELEVGEAAPVVVLRAGRRVELIITPASRD